MSTSRESRKVGLVGAGMVGSSFAYALMQRSLASELVIVDANNERAIGEAMDLNHGLPFVRNMRISAGDYSALAESSVMVIAAKGNQPTLHDAIRAAFAEAHTSGFASLAHDTYQTEETPHGRWERRTYWTLMEPAVLAKVNPTGRWPTLRCIGMVRVERRVDGKTSVEERFSIASLEGNARTFAFAVRGHWGIENSVHWLLDLVFREDECRISVGKGAENLAVLRHSALNLLQQDRSAKQSMKQKRFRAALDPKYLLRLLAGPAPATGS